MKALFLPFREAVTTQKPGIVWNVSYTFHDLIDLAPTSRYLTFGYPTRKSDERGLRIIQGLKRSDINAGRTVLWKEAVVQYIVVQASSVTEISYMHKLLI